MKNLLRKFFLWLFPESFGAVSIPDAPYLFITTLQSNIGSSDSSMTLNSGVLKNGASLSGIQAFTIDAGTATAEYVIGTCSGTSITAMIRGIDPQNPAVGVTALQFGHRRGADVRMTDFPVLQIMKRLLNGQDALPNALSYDGAVTPTLAAHLVNKAYVDAVAIAGAPNASSTVKGISKLSIDPVSGTNPISVGDNDTRVPTQGENDALVGTSGTPSSSNPFVTALGIAPTGVIQMFANGTPPTGWLNCDGSAVSRTTYAALFAVVSTLYGTGDGSTTFNVPDFRGRVAIGVGTGTGGGASGSTTTKPAGGSALTLVSMGTWKGEETHQLTVPELASHNHALAVPSAGGGATLNTTNAATTWNTSYIQSAGGDTPHNNIQPVMGVNFIIKT
jgi:microcystin-dependent protein